VAPPPTLAVPRTASASTDNCNTTLVMTATYNEIENLPRLVDEVFAFVPAVHLLVVDDNSPDGTGVWCDRKAAEDRRVHVLHRAGKLGLGTAMIAGIRYAIDRAYTYVVNMDADFSHHPRYLPAMIAGMEPPLAEPIDVMIGSRYTTGGGTVGWPLKRKIMSRGVNLYARWLLWLRARDVSGGYRCYRVSKLAELDFNQVRSRGYSFQEEILWMLRRRGARIAETPIVFADREQGTSKINSREAVAALRIIARLGMQNITGR
jgi:dolichol-phosphate mannosyltransferase